MMTSAVNINMMTPAARFGSRMLLMTFITSTTSRRTVASLDGIRSHRSCPLRARRSPQRRRMVRSSFRGLLVPKLELGNAGQNSARSWLW